VPPIFVEIIDGVGNARAGKGRGLSAMADVGVVVEGGDAVSLVGALPIGVEGVGLALFTQFYEACPTVPNPDAAVVVLECVV